MLIVHRPSYDDWSLPKGKADGEESPEETAVREVLEETGYRCRVVSPIRITRYPVGEDMKEVAWFAMRPLPDSPGFHPGREIDAIKWLDPEEAARTLHYDNDRSLVGDPGLAEAARTGTLRLVRHAAAGSRGDWDGDDLLRPLTAKGARQAEALAGELGNRGIERILSSPSVRCLQTVEPLASATGAEIEVEGSLAEGADPSGVHGLMKALAGSNAVLCSHGDVIPAAMRRLAWEGLELVSDLHCSKGSVWEVEVERGRLTTARYLPPPPV